ncbi:MAG TPA: hypothetical protein VHP37_31130 [Burkholderiales bacterium]|nr:hypothetical protein [Burkholderiales bacterium]
MSAAWIAPRTRAVAGAISAAMVVAAFAAAPRSCEGGLELYFVAGLVGVAALAALPFIARAGWPAASCIGPAAGYAGFGVAVWIAALFIANVRILCRLF